MVAKSFAPFSDGETNTLARYHQLKCANSVICRVLLLGIVPRSYANPRFAGVLLGAGCQKSCKSQKSTVLCG